MTTRLIFMGTPDFAVLILKALLPPPSPPLKGGGVGRGWEVVAVVTQPDRPSGRGKQVTPPPVKVVAEQAGVKVLQPETLKDEAVVAQLAALRPEVMVVAAFGQILRKNVLALPKYGCLNVHASLLPRWRGAAPVAAAIRAGDAETGVTIMLMDEGLDTGPMLARRAVPITPHHTGGSLTVELAEVGAALLVETLPAWLAGQLEAQPQDSHLATLAPRLKKEQGEINWLDSAVEIERQVRAYNPWPGAFTYGPRGLIKIIAVQVAPKATGPLEANPGLLFRHKGGVYVTTGNGVIRLVTVQPAGKKEMAAEAMVNGQPELLGSTLNGQL